MQLAQKSFSKWNNYAVKIDESLINNINKFVPIDGNNKSNAKSYRLTKNRNSTGVFDAKQDLPPQNNEINIPNI